MSSREITKAILSTECPFCEKPKLDGHCFCDSCYQKLPDQIKSRIKTGIQTLSEAIRGGITFLEN